MCITSCIWRKISSTDAKSVITEMRRTAVKNKYVLCGLHYFWIILQKMVNLSSLSDCIMTIMEHRRAYYKNWKHTSNYCFSQDMKYHMQSTLLAFT
jgi:hypothetical protein